MDVLSQAVTAARTGRPSAYRVVCHRPWGRTFSPVPGAGLHVILEGSAWLTPATHPPVALGVGDVVVLPHGDGHGMADRPETPLLPMTHVATRALDVEQGTTTVGPDDAGVDDVGTVMLCGMYRFTRHRPHPLIAALPGVIHLPARLGQHDELRSTLDMLAAELRRPCPGSHVAITALLDLLLVHALRACYQDSPHIGWGAALTDRTVSVALQAIHAEPAHAWTVEELGALTSTSRATFARRFKQLVSQGPLTYLTWWRMTLAADLLRHGDAPLAAIARQVGYTSEFAFANAFKREYGTSPGRYRRPNDAK